ncbi:MAG TPA: calcium-binding protein, partial [Ramlibacter sp.]
DDVLDGSFGTDTLVGGLGNDTYHVDSKGDQVDESGGGGVDTVISSVNFTLGLDTENLTLDLGARVGVGNAGANLLRGTRFDNVLDGAAGADTLQGGAGDDVYKVDHRGDVVVEAGKRGTDTVVSVIDFALENHQENLALAGAAAIDGTGNAQSNSLRGNEAANRLDGGSGRDTMTGGRGDDTYLVDHAGDQVLESRSGGADTVVSTVSFTLARFVENLTLAGSVGAGTGNDSDNVLRGNDAANVLDGRDGADTMVGGLGNDKYHVDDLGDVVRESRGTTGGTDTVLSALKSYVLSDRIENLTLTGSAKSGTGNALANAIRGNAGDNSLDGGGGADTLAGGEGNDTYVIDADDVVHESFDGGWDTVVVDRNWTLGSGVEALSLTGSAALSGFGNLDDNHLLGNDGANVLDGRGGRDTLEGGKGNDTYYFTDDSDLSQTVVERGGGGVDLVVSSGDHSLQANVENLTLVGDTANVWFGVGNAGANVLKAGDGEQMLAGGGGDDTLSAGTGNDSLQGGEGSDRLTGGSGQDAFVYRWLGESRRGAHDVIIDFERGTDRLDFSEFFGDSLTFIGDQGFGADATNQLRFNYDGASKSVMLYGSTDEDSRAEFVVQLSGLSTLSAGDFLFD